MKINRKLQYILYGIAAILLLLGLIVFLPFDDKLDAAAAEWAQLANDTQDMEGNAYYFLMGIQAGANDDPETVGKAMIASYLQAEQEFLRGDAAEFVAQEYPKEQMLALPSGEFYCRIHEPGCYSRLADSPAGLRGELQTHAELLNRYRRYLQFAGVKPLVTPAHYERFSPYHYLSRGHKLNQLLIIGDSVAGNRSRALEALYQDIERVRRHLAAAPNLLHKMLMLAFLVEDLDLLANLAGKTAVVRPIPALTEQERSLHLPMVREFGYAANFHRQLREHPAAIGPATDIYERVMRATIKSNMSVNDLFPRYRAAYELSLIAPAEFNRRFAAGASEPEVAFSLRNIGGWILNSLAAVDFAGYIARLHDLDAKIALVNAVTPLDQSEWENLINGSAELAAANPYNPEERPYIDPATQSLCFNGPFEDVQRRRCVRKDR